MHAVAPVEAKLELGEVALGVLAELECVVRSCEGGLQVAQQYVDGAKFWMLGAGRRCVCAGVGNSAEVDGAAQRREPAWPGSPDVCASPRD